MSISAISGTSGIDPIQTEHPSVAAGASGQAAPSASAITTGTQPPLSPAMLATLIGQQLTLYGSFN